MTSAFFTSAFGSWSEFLQMGKHGVYVWSAYGVTAVLLLACIMIGYGRHRYGIARIRRLKNRASHASRS